MGSLTSPRSARHHISPFNAPRIYLRHGLPAYPRTTIAWAELPSCVTPSLAYYHLGSRTGPAPDTPEGTPGRAVRLASAASTGAHPSGYGNINPLSIDYACRPRLRPRLTLGGLAWPRNPWSSGGRVSHPAFATHACILTRVHSTPGSHRSFTADTTLPYPPAHPEPPPGNTPTPTPISPRTHPEGAAGTDTTRAPTAHPPQRGLEPPPRGAEHADATASAVCLSPATLSARNHLTSELLRTLSRMAASKPTSWLSQQLHILSHLAHA
jgi:hypothetical protein